MTDREICESLIKYDDTCKICNVCSDICCELCPLNKDNLKFHCLLYDTPKLAAQAWLNVHPDPDNSYLVGIAVCDKL